MGAEVTSSHSGTIRDMADVRIASEGDGSALELQLVGELATLLRRSTYTGLLPIGSVVDPARPGWAQLDRIGRSMALHGLPAGSAWDQLQRQEAWLELLAHPGGDRPLSPPLVADLVAVLRHMNEAIEMSPQPVGEWEPVTETLGEDLVAELVGTSVSSVRRYAAGTRDTPQRIAERLHVLALVLADLAGSYNDFGMRRWFTRPRRALDGRRPADLLGDFDPEGSDAVAVLRLAAPLAGAGAA